MARRVARLPMDPPPRPGVANQHGLVVHGSLGQQFFPFPYVPYTSYQSTVFPKVASSACAPNGLKPNWVVFINTYSPISHRNPLTQHVPRPIGDSRGVGRVTQKPRGYGLGKVTRWPQMSPRWPSFGENGGDSA